MKIALMALFIDNLHVDLNMSLIYSKNIIGNSTKIVARNIMRKAVDGLRDLSNNVASSFAPQFASLAVA